jgi:hypothetical protein
MRSSSHLYSRWKSGVEASRWSSSSGSRTAATSVSQSPSGLLRRCEWSKRYRLPPTPLREPESRQDSQLIRLPRASGIPGLLLSHPGRTG